MKRSLFVAPLDSFSIKSNFADQYVWILKYFLISRFNIQNEFTLTKKRSGKSIVIFFAEFYVNKTYVILLPGW